ncbi:MAG: competence/damage-inducible protein A [Candidatus Cloacimonetes bacterium]|nr:competence/damage-inducible protein A [Candidatus Cloacimonadota bacterium]
MKKIGLITIGTEILLGKTVNTNQTFIGNELTKIGFQLDESITIKDDNKTILGAFERMCREFDIVISTGGLGPTNDDITKKCIAKFFKKNLKFREEIWRKIEKSYTQKNMEIPKIVRTQAEVPEDFIAIENNFGTAPGLHFKEKGKHFFAFPGVPSEMKPMVKNYLLPFLKNKYRNRSFYLKTIRTFGIREAVLAEKLDYINESKNVKIAFLPQLGKVDIRVYGSNKHEFHFTIREIKKKIKKFIYGYDDDTIPKLCHEKLIKRKKTLAIAESCTGGLIQNLFTNHSGSSKYLLGGIVSYSNNAKMKLLNVREKTLQKFGAVSSQTIEEMLKGVKKRFQSDCAIAVSGIAGPTGGSEQKPVGLVFIGINIDGKNIIREYHLSGDRMQIKKKAAMSAIHLLLKNI